MPPTPYKAALLLCCCPSHLFSPLGALGCHSVPAAEGAQSLWNALGLLTPGAWNTRHWASNHDQQLISHISIFSSRKNERAAKWGAASSRECSSLLEKVPSCSFAIRCEARWIAGKETALDLGFLNKPPLELGKGNSTSHHNFLILWTNKKSELFCKG